MLVRCVRFKKGTSCRHPIPFARSGQQPAAASSRLCATASFGGRAYRSATKRRRRRTLGTLAFLRQNGRCVYVATYCLSRPQPVHSHGPADKSRLNKGLRRNEYVLVPPCAAGACLLLLAAAARCCCLPAAAAAAARCCSKQAAALSSGPRSKQFFHTALVRYGEPALLGELAEKTASDSHLLLLQTRSRNAESTFHTSTPNPTHEAVHEEEIVGARTGMNTPLFD